MFDTIVSVPYLDDKSAQQSQRPKSYQGFSRPAFFRSISTQSVYSHNSDNNSHTSTATSSASSLLTANDKRPDLRSCASASTLQTTGSSSSK